MTAITLSPRARKRLVNRGLDVLTWVVLAVMLAPVFWLVASSLQNDGQLARGSYDLLHPTFQAFKDMWKTIDFELKPGEQVFFEAINRTGPGTYVMLLILGAGPLYLTLRRMV